MHVYLSRIRYHDVSHSNFGDRPPDQLLRNDPQEKGLWLLLQRRSKILDLVFPGSFVGVRDHPIIGFDHGNSREASVSTLMRLADVSTQAIGQTTSPQNLASQLICPQLLAKTTGGTQPPQIFMPSIDSSTHHVSNRPRFEQLKVRTGHFSGSSPTSKTLIPFGLNIRYLNPVFSGH